MSTADSPLGNVVLRAGKYDPDSPGAEGLAKLFAKIGAEKPGRLVIHFHGGLVSREVAEAAAAKLTPHYAKAGALPIFLIWETGWWEVTKQQVEAVFEERFFQRVLRRVTQFVKGKLDKEFGPDGARGFDAELSLAYEQDIAREIEIGKAGGEMFSGTAVDDFPPEKVAAPDDSSLSVTEQQQIQTEIENDPQLQDMILAIARSREPEQADGGKGEAGPIETSLMDAEKLAEIAPLRTPAGEPQPRAILSTLMLAKSVAVIVGAVIWRFAKKRGHGPYLTLVEEVMREFYVRAAGRFLWQGMKDEVDAAFGATDDCGGTALVKQLDAMWRAGVRPSLTLVAHSAGSIYVARLLTELDARMPEDFTLNVIFIAPACTFDVLARALRTAGRRVAAFRIFGMGDQTEAKDALAALVYPASLLYFVSGVLEENRDEPLAGMQRYYKQPYGEGEFPTIASVK